MFKVTDDNSTNTLYALLRRLGVVVTRASVRNELLMHPYFPSLLSLSEVLEDWEIENRALQLKTVEQLRQIPTPFIAHMRDHGGWFVLVTKLNGNHIVFSDTDSRHKTLSIKEFEEHWSGAILIAEVDNQSVVSNYADNPPNTISEKLRMPLLLACTMLFTLLAVPNVANRLINLDWILIATKSFGLFISILLMSRQLGTNGLLGDRLCQASKKINCDSILNSPGSKLWGWLSWDDIGLIYFAGGLSSILFFVDQNDLRPLYNGLALSALPYVFYSIYYQAYVIGKWCSLCLLIQVVLVIESVFAVMQLTILPSFWQPYSNLLMAFTGVTLLWAIIRPMLSDRTQDQSHFNQLMRLKRDPKLFETLLFQQTKMPTLQDDLLPMVIGNPGAKNTITMVTNPYCDPCSKIHNELNRLISRNDSIKANIIFLCDGENGRTTQVATRILDLAKQNKAEKALTEWYEQPEKNFDKWTKRYPVYSNKNHWIAVARRHSEWCQTAAIAVTPTVYINGFKLPEDYSLTHLKWILKNNKSITIE